MQPTIGEEIYSAELMKRVLVSIAPALGISKSYVYSKSLGVGMVQSYTGAVTVMVLVWVDVAPPKAVAHTS